MMIWRVCKYVHVREYFEFVKGHKINNFLVVLLHDDVNHDEIIFPSFFLKIELNFVKKIDFFWKIVHPLHVSKYSTFIFVCGLLYFLAFSSWLTFLFYFLRALRKCKWIKCSMYERMARGAWRWSECANKLSSNKHSRKKHKT